MAVPPHSFACSSVLFSSAPENRPPAGTPPKPDVCYFHYRAPTEGGSSGSPVFEPEVWRVIALHHAGGANRRKLNGKAGSEPANEGIWIQSIVKAVAAANVQV